ncbi:hypothetical protein [Streptomyces sp. NPDC054787]
MTMERGLVVRPVRARLGAARGVRVEVAQWPTGPRTAPGWAPAGPQEPSPAVREAVEAIVRAVAVGDDVLIDRLLARFTDIADYDALVHLRTALCGTAGARPAHH